MDNQMDGRPEQKSGDLALGSQPVDSTNLLDQNDYSYDKIFGGEIPEKQSPQEEFKSPQNATDRQANSDYLKITNAAETFERLAEIRLDTTDATRGEETSKQMANLWGSLNQEERSAVFVSLLSRHESHGEWSGFPSPNLILDMDGTITGLSFEAGKLDFRPGPKSLQISDSQNSSVVVKTRTGDRFSTKQAELVTDYHQGVTPEFAKESEFDPTPTADYAAMRKTAENIEFIAKNRLDTTDLREAEETQPNAPQSVSS